jgi:hypothetical protein
LSERDPFFHQIVTVRGIFRSAMAVALRTLAWSGGGAAAFLWRALSAAQMPLRTGSGTNKGC